MRLEKVQDALRAKKIKYEYTEEDGCGSLDFMFRGLKFHVCRDVSFLPAVFKGMYSILV